jgi:hypothetical protein
MGFALRALVRAATIVELAVRPVAVDVFAMLDGLERIVLHVPPITTVHHARIAWHLLHVVVAALALLMVHVYAHRHLRTVTPGLTAAVAVLGIMDRRVLVVQQLMMVKYVEESLERHAVMVSRVLEYAHVQQGTLVLHVSIPTLSIAMDMVQSTLPVFAHVLQDLQGVLAINVQPAGIPTPTATLAATLQRPLRMDLVTPTQAQ